MSEFILLLVINLVLVGAVIVYWRKNNLDNVFIGLKKYTLILSAGWIGLSILIGLFLAFQDLENSKIFSYQLLVRDGIVALRFFAFGMALIFLFTWIPISFLKRAQQKN